MLEKWLGMGKSPSSSVKNLSSLRYVEMNKSDFMRKAGFSHFSEGIANLFADLGGSSPGQRYV